METGREPIQIWEIFKEVKRYHPRIIKLFLGTMEREIKDNKRLENLISGYISNLSEDDGESHYLLGINPSDNPSKLDKDKIRVAAYLMAKEEIKNPL